MLNGDSKITYSASWRQRVPWLMASEPTARKFRRVALRMAPCV